MSPFSNILAASDRRIGVLRGGFSAASLVEAFLDPTLIIALLFTIAAAHGCSAFDAPYVVLGLLAFSLAFPGDVYLNDHPRRMVRKTAFNWLFLASTLLAFGYASGYLHNYPQNVIVEWVGGTPFALIAGHLLARATLPRIMSMEGNQRTVIIAGCNDIGLRLARNFTTNLFLGLRFVGFFDDRTRERLKGIDDSPLLGNFSQIAEFINHNHVDHLYLALPMASQPRILKVLDSLKDTTVSIFFVPDIFITDIIQGRLYDVVGMPVVAVCETPFTGFDGILKRGSDIVLSLLILILISPLMLAVAAGVKLSSRGPVIFRQRRYGLDGKQIVVYKFRSMTACDDGQVVRQATRNDSRITPFGAFIRRTSLDELPQFVNVLQGRMSIVGPRPHAVAHNETYRKLIKGYMVRHKVKPGITGWAQVNGYRGETDTVEKMERRIEFDLEYLRHWSLGLDLWIIVKTAYAVIRGDQQAY